MGINIVTKMSVKTIGADPAKGKTGRVHLARIFGIASGIKVAKGTNGDILYGVTGDFRGQIPDAPEDTYQSGVLYLPSGINELLLQAVDSGEVDKNNKPVFREVKFAFDIFSKPASNPAGYQYEATPVIDAKETDAMSELSSQLPPMPGAAAQIADETKTAKKGK